MGFIKEKKTNKQTNKTKIGLKKRLKQTKPWKIFGRLKLFFSYQIPIMHWIFCCCLTCLLFILLSSLNIYIYGYVYSINFNTTIKNKSGSATALSVRYSPDHCWLLGYGKGTNFSIIKVESLDFKVDFTKGVRWPGSRDINLILVPLFAYSNRIIIFLSDIAIEFDKHKRKIKNYKRSTPLFVTLEYLCLYNSSICRKNIAIG